MQWGTCISALLFEDELMARFRLLSGRFYDRGQESTKKKGPHSLDNMTLHKAGDFVESEIDLVEKFPNKFERVIEPPPIQVSQARKEAVTKLIDSGVWTGEDRTFLQELPDSGFDRILRQAGIAAPKAPDEDEEIGDDEDEDKAKKAKPHKLFGDDVTADFTAAEANGLKVYKNAAGKHQILKGRGTKPINPEPLDEDQVHDAIGEYVTSKE